jgi:hypothetical protein
MPSARGVPVAAAPPDRRRSEQNRARIAGFRRLGSAFVSSMRVFERCSVSRMRVEKRMATACYRKCFTGNIAGPSDYGFIAAI